MSTARRTRIDVLIRNRISELVLWAGSQVALARALHVSPTVVCRWRQGVHGPDRTSITRLDDLYFSVPPRKRRRSFNPRAKYEQTPETLPQG